MQYRALCRSLLTAVWIGGLACASSGSGTTEGSGGSSSAEGGATSSGGSSASGGNTGAGGSGASGGSIGSIGQGGSVGTGGVVSTGGAAGTGSGGAGGRGGSGGTTSTGGASGSAGHAGAGGGSGSGGTTATGGTGTATGGAGGMFVGTKSPGTAQTGDITVNPATTYQVVDGFGEADVWQGSSSTAMQTLLFDPVNGIGLTLLRIGIDGTSGNERTHGSCRHMPMVRPASSTPAADCKVWAAPWSPPAGDKNNNNVNNGAATTSCRRPTTTRGPRCSRRFLRTTSSTAAWTSTPISAQNEPDFTAKLPVVPLQHDPDGELGSTCWAQRWPRSPRPSRCSRPSPTTGATSGAATATAPPSWPTRRPTPTSGRSPRTTTGTPARGRTHVRRRPRTTRTTVWETECTPNDTGPITIATMVYAAFTTGGVNAWHYWWTEAFVPNVSSPPPQVYALGNFSKFVRPGYYRVDVTGAPTPSGIRASGGGVHEPAGRDGGHRRGERWRGATGFLLRRGHGVAGVRHPVRHHHELQAGWLGRPSRVTGGALLRLPRRAVRHDVRGKTVTYLQRGLIPPSRISRTSFSTSGNSSDLG